MVNLNHCFVQKSDATKTGLFTFFTADAVFATNVNKGQDCKLQRGYRQSH